GSRAGAAGTGTGARAGRSTAAASGAPTGRPAAPAPRPGTPARRRSASSAGQARAGARGSHDRRSAHTVPSGGGLGLQSRAAMDALHPFMINPTRRTAVLGITHLAAEPARGWVWIRRPEQARSGTGRAERRRDLLDGLRLGGTHVLAAFAVRGRDLVRQG